MFSRYVVGMGAIVAHDARGCRWVAWRRGVLVYRFERKPLADWAGRVLVNATEPAEPWITDVEEDEMREQCKTLASKLDGDSDPRFPGRDSARPIARRDVRPLVGCQIRTPRWANGTAPLPGKVCESGCCGKAASAARRGTALPGVARRTRLCVATPWERRRDSKPGISGPARP